ncbi:hypothetical protein IAE30_07615 [Pantoea sp. S61]|uniref:hypothetical protein n=1 Tax=Pantoea sp. S61 TaxID=2767442 RepID=UPI00190D70AE|nr:hypothetical protein [Pantoea sp. S61]MBK0123608.1 hypothetical protein [Pantoea sp. S61]
MHEDNLEASKHKHFSEGLVILGDRFGEGAYVDIEFILSGCSKRRIEIRLLFMPPSVDPAAAETMHQMIGEEIASLFSIQVVSFYDRATEENPCADGNPFGKPAGGLDLHLHELNYLYKTIVEMIFRVADTEKIELIFFGADNEKLQRVYDRYIKRYAEKMGFLFTTQGAYYAIRTQHCPDQ